MEVGGSVGGSVPACFKKWLEYFPGLSALSTALWWLSDTDRMLRTVSLSLTITMLVSPSSSFCCHSNWGSGLPSPSQRRLVSSPTFTSGDWNMSVRSNYGTKCEDEGPGRIWRYYLVFSLVKSQAITVSKTGVKQGWTNFNFHFLLEISLLHGLRFFCKLRHSPWWMIHCIKGYNPHLFLVRPS